MKAAPGAEIPALDGLCAIAVTRVIPAHGGPGRLSVCWGWHYREYAPVAG